MSTENAPAGMTRRQLIRHGAWFGAAVVLTVAGGEVISHVAGAASNKPQSTPTLRFAQISDSHIGFHGPANPNVTDTFNHAIGQINSSATHPISSSTPVTSPTFRHRHNSIRSSRC